MMSETGRKLTEFFPCNDVPTSNVKQSDDDLVFELLICCYFIFKEGGKSPYTS